MWVLAENERLIENEALDFLVSSNLLKRSTGLLVEMSREIAALQQDESHPLEDYQELISAYNRLNEFVEKALAFHEGRFGLPEKEAEERRRKADNEMAQLNNERAT